ncbi:MAG: glycosyltransferase family 4 protein [Desulfobacterales bacterium]|jgi:glycosyltransferase involved in cell wall biosynthesis|nr:glycosyltransferase family 4 protein [Desulfobacterales bacterium]MDP6806676.1 glycosyltransferase family 4 protein [Desulfobacterales bacterium]|tara:strand:+ start:31191 stop:32312 length:1122 start_codon:yes stop_codon:yes gene_type:complete
MKKDGNFAFIKIGSFSHINDSVVQALRNSFPNYEIDIIDIWHDIIKRYDVLNFINTLKMYAKEIIRANKRFDQCMLRTPFLFQKVKSKIVEKLEHQEYTFTFQTQSLFDCSIPSIPHFVYTDHTHLANLRYPAFSISDLYSDSWIELEKSIYKNAALNFTMSRNVESSLITQYACDADRVRCVYAGNNVKGIEKEVFDDRRYANKNVLFVGVDWKRKGGPQLAEAFKIVLKSHPDARLVIIGCSPSLDLPRCEILGKIPLKDMKYYYKKASIFCLPTRIEPFGIVFLEAMAYGLPVVASNIGAIPDFITRGENGYLVDPDDTRQLADRIIMLLNDPSLCSQFGVAGSKLVRNRYTWDKTGKQIRDSIMGIVSL